MDAMRECYLTSNDILEHHWNTRGNISGIFSQDAFCTVAWGDLHDQDFGVFTYPWNGAVWADVVKSLEDSNNVDTGWLWIDIFCLDQKDPEKMEVIKRTAELYSRAKEYHVIGFQTIVRGWCTAELASVRVPTRFHHSFTGTTSKHEEKFITELAASGGELKISVPSFQDSKFTVEDDRSIVRGIIQSKFGSVDKFDKHLHAMLSTDPKWSETVNGFFAQRRVKQNELHAADRAQLSLQQVRCADGALVTASGKFHANENPSRLFDGSMGTKFYSMDDETHALWQKGDLAETKHWVTYTPVRPIMIGGYEIVSGNDSDFRDPTDWILEGRSTSGAGWVELDRRKEVEFGGRKEARQFELATPSGLMTDLRLRILKTKGGSTPWQATAWIFSELHRITDTFAVSSTVSQAALAGRSMLSLQGVRASNGAVAVASGSFHQNESPACLFDGSKNTKFYCMPHPETRARWKDLPELKGTLHWLVYKPSNEMLSFKSYAIVSGNDCDFRDPADWVLEGRLGVQLWRKLDERAAVTFEARKEMKVFEMGQPSGPLHEVRLRLLKTKGGDTPWQATQLIFQDDRMGAAPSVGPSSADLEAAAALIQGTAGSADPAGSEGDA